MRLRRCGSRLAGADRLALVLDFVRVLIVIRLLVFLAICTPRFRRDAYEDAEPS